MSRRLSKFSRHFVLRHARKLVRQRKEGNTSHANQHSSPTTNRSQDSIPCQSHDTSILSEIGPLLAQLNSTVKNLSDTVQNIRVPQVNKVSKALLKEQLTKLKIQNSLRQSEATAKMKELESKAEYYQSQAGRDPLDEKVAAYLAMKRSHAQRKTPSLLAAVSKEKSGKSPLANLVFTESAINITTEELEKVNSAFFDIHGCQWLGRLTPTQRNEMQSYIEYCVDRLAEEKTLRRQEVEIRKKLQQCEKIKADALRSKVEHQLLTDIPREVKLEVETAKTELAKATAELRKAQTVNTALNTKVGEGEYKLKQEIAQARAAGIDHPMDTDKGGNAFRLPFPFGGRK